MRPLETRDVDNLHRVWTLPLVRKYLFDDHILPRVQVGAMVAESMDLFTKYGHGLWAVHLQGRPALIGFCGYWYFHEPPELQLIYGIEPSHWGQGLATEAAEAMLTYGLEDLELDRVVASANAPNLASVRVMEKLGMSFEKRVDIEGQETVYYARERPSPPAE